MSRDFSRISLAVSLLALLVAVFGGPTYLVMAFIAISSAALAVSWVIP